MQCRSDFWRETTPSAHSARPERGTASFLGYLRVYTPTDGLLTTTKDPRSFCRPMGWHNGALTEARGTKACSDVGGRLQMTLTLWLQPSADTRENSMNPVCSHVTSDRHTFDRVVMCLATNVGTYVSELWYASINSRRQTCQRPRSVGSRVQTLEQSFCGCTTRSSRIGRWRARNWT